MAKDFINDNKVISVDNSSPGLLIEQKNSGEAITLYQANDGKVVFVEPQGSALPSSDLLIKVAQVIETEDDLTELLANRRHYFASSVFSINTTTNNWTDTNIDIEQGLPYGAYAYGLARVANGGNYEFTPDGGPDFGTGDPAFADGCDVAGAEQFRHLALIGKVGINGTPFLIGECFFDAFPASAGRLYIRCNDVCAGDNDGIFRAVVRYIERQRPTTNAYYIKDNSVYEFNGINWIKSQTKTIASELGIGRMVYDDRTLKTYFIDSASSVLYIGQTFKDITESKSNVTGLEFSPSTAFVLTSQSGWRYLVYVTDTGEIRTSRICFESDNPSEIPPRTCILEPATGAWTNWSCYDFENNISTLTGNLGDIATTLTFNGRLYGGRSDAGLKFGATPSSCSTVEYRDTNGTIRPAYDTTDIPPPAGNSIFSNNLATTFTLNLSRAVSSLYFLYSSFDQANNITFNRLFELTVNGEGRWGSGTIQSINNGNGTFTLRSTGGISNGIIKFPGPINSLTWTTTVAESWNLFNVGSTDVIFCHNNIITNGNFTNSTAELQGGTAPGWTLNNVDVHDISNYGIDNQPENHFIDLVSVGNNGFIEQTVTTVINTVYSLTFYLGADRQTQQDNADRTVTVSWGTGADESQTYTIAPFEVAATYDSFGWQKYTLVFTADSVSTTLRFAGSTGTANYGPVIDNICLKAVENLPEGQVWNNVTEQSTLVGDVFDTSAINRQRLYTDAELAVLTPVTYVSKYLLDVTNRSFAVGFPQVPNLFEWFQIRFFGRLVVPVTGNYNFRLCSDDGAILTIDGLVRVNNDGQHAMNCATGTILNLTAGLHDLRVDYYQGPRFFLGVTLEWQPPGAAGYSLIPQHNYMPPAGFTGVWPIP